MVWAILALLGVPLWLCAIGIGALVFRNRALRKRPGNVPVRVLRPGKKRWTPGHAVWVSDVFAWRASPASWMEGLARVTDASLHESIAPETMKKLHRLGDSPSVASLTLDDGTTIDVAARQDDQVALMGPFAPPADVVQLQAVEHSR
jgi:hypothetical protein